MKAIHSYRLMQHVSQRGTGPEQEPVLQNRRGLQAMLERIEQTFQLLKTRGYVFKTLDQITVEGKAGHAAHLPTCSRFLNRGA